MGLLGKIFPSSNIAKRTGDIRQDKRDLLMFVHGVSSAIMLSKLELALCPVPTSQIRCRVKGLENERTELNKHRRVSVNQQHPDPQESLHLGSEA